MFRASAWMTSTFVSPCSVTSSPRHGDVDRVDLQSYDAAPGADALGEQLEDSTRAASDVDRALSLSGADSVQ